MGGWVGPAGKAAGPVRQTGRPLGNPQQKHRCKTAGKHAGSSVPQSACPPGGAAPPPSSTYHPIPAATECNVDFNFRPTSIDMSCRRRCTSQTCTERRRSRPTASSRPPLSSAGPRACGSKAGSGYGREEARGVKAVHLGNQQTTVPHCCSPLPPARCAPPGPRGSQQSSTCRQAVPVRQYRSAPVPVPRGLLAN